MNVYVSVRTEGELYEKMLNLVELTGMPIESVVEVLVNTGIEAHASENADFWLKMLEKKKAPLGKRDA